MGLQLKAHLLSAVELIAEEFPDVVLYVILLPVPDHKNITVQIVQMSDPHLPMALADEIALHESGSTEFRLMYDMYDRPHCIVQM